MVGPKKGACAAWDMRKNGCIAITPERMGVQDAEKGRVIPMEKKYDVFFDF